MLLQSDLRASYFAHQAEIDTAISRVLNSGWYILGQEVEDFERAFAAYLGVNHTIGVANGTEALEIALRACGVGTGDIVITVSHTAVATVAAIELIGATAHLVDVDPQTFTMELNQLEDAIKKSQQKRLPLRAIVPVHLYGHPANLPAIMALADRYQLYVIEDCAQSHGAVSHGRKTGSWGHLAAFSFYPTKNLGALGDGGAVVTNDAKLANKIRCLREYGWQQRYISEIPGMNSRLDPLQAAILKVKLRYLEEENKQRQTLAHLYDNLLAQTSLSLPQKYGPVEHVYHQYVIRTPQRNQLQEFLKTHAINTLIHYPVPIHQQPAYRGRVTLSLPETEKICQAILSLPMHPYLSAAQIERVSDLVTYWSLEKT